MGVAAQPGIIGPLQVVKDIGQVAYEVTHALLWAWITLVVESASVALSVSGQLHSPP